MSDDDEAIARDLNARDMLAEVREVKEILLRLESVVTQIALSLGIHPPDPSRYGGVARAR